MITTFGILRLEFDLTVILCLSCLLSCQPLEQVKRPNILLIMTDQHPTSCVGAYGNKVIKTPNLDYLASSGHVLQRYYIAAFACSPSRASLLTGRFLHRHNVFTNNVILDPDIPVMGRILKHAGYRTGYFGKAHLGGYMYAGRVGGDGVDYLHKAGEAEDPIGEDIKDYWHFERKHTAGGWMPQKQLGGPGEDQSQLGFSTWKGGWRDYKDWLVAQGRSDFAALAGNHDALQSAPEGSHMYSRLGEQWHMARYFTEETEAFIREPSEEPWAAVLSYFGPHLPVAPPQPWDTLYALDEVDLPSNIDDDLKGKPRKHHQPKLQYVLGQWETDQYKYYIRRYWGYSSYIDHQIGRIIEVLEEEQQLDHTIIVFTTDHGDMVGAHGMIFKLGGNAYEELFRVPAIIRIPGIAPSRDPIRALTSSIDILPTLLDAADVDLPEGMDGRSLVPLLTGQEQIHRDAVFAEVHALGDGKILMCRDERYKYIYHWLSEDIDELYDLQEDPGELNNLFESSEHQDLVVAMRRKILAWAESSHHPYYPLIQQKVSQGMPK